jgi:hypothetical protein
MAYDEKLAERVRRLLNREPSFSERKMFGGICFLLRGRMCCGVLGDELIVRTAADEYAAALARPHVRVFDFTGWPMKGFIVVGPRGHAAANTLRAWIDCGRRAALRPAKRRKKRATARRRAA